MTIKGITYSDENMTKSASLCESSMGKNGIQSVSYRDYSYISREFETTNKAIFDGKRGAGCYWIFKPYIIYDIMLLLSDNDILVYSDAGVEWIANVQHIIKAMDQDIFLFSNGHQHSHWCKADIMQAILGKQIPVEYQQVQASVIVFRVNDFTRRFVKEWLLYCQMPGLIDDSPSVLPNHPEFAENRHDQAILSTLAYKYSIRQHWWADQLWYESQRYRWPEDTYPSMFRHHRKRNNEWS